MMRRALGEDDGSCLMALMADDNFVRGFVKMLRPLTYPVTLRDYDLLEKSGGRREEWRSVKVKSRRSCSWCCFHGIR